VRIAESKNHGFERKLVFLNNIFKCVMGLFSRTEQSCLSLGMIRPGCSTNERVTASPLCSPSTTCRRPNLVEIACLSPITHELQPRSFSASLTSRGHWEHDNEAGRRNRKPPNLERLERRSRVRRSSPPELLQNDFSRSFGLCRKDRALDVVSPWKRFPVPAVAREYLLVGSN
jgi:hypothetical protein